MKYNELHVGIIMKASENMVLCHENVKPCSSGINNHLDLFVFFILVFPNSGLGLVRNIRRDGEAWHILRSTTHHPREWWLGLQRREIHHLRRLHPLDVQGCRNIRSHHRFHPSNRVHCKSRNDPPTITYPSQFTDFLIDWSRYPILQIRDAYMLKIFESNTSRLPSWCSNQNGQLPFCQILGEYWMELPGYNTLEPYANMNENCPSLPPDYERPVKC